MLIVPGKSGGEVYKGSGLFDFGKILLKKSLSSNLVRKASQAINSELGQKAIKAVKQVAASELGQELQNRAISGIQEKISKASNDALNKVNLPDTVKKAAKSEFGQHLQKQIISEIGENSQKLANNLGITAPVGSKAKNITKSTFTKLGIAQPVRKRKAPPKKGKSSKKRKKGAGFVYPQKLLNQFVGNGIILEK